MRTLDLSPLFRSTVGYDRMMRMLDNAQSDLSAPSYPPYNIVKNGDDAYAITMAVAGFSDDELDVTVHENKLVVTGQSKAEPSESEQVLHRGIANRAFERRFDLADHIKVRDARLENGLLHIDLVREVPEALKPRKIAINSVASESLIDTTAHAA
ncbi:MAG: Hsp20 family protein [Pseudomonadota bacterium]